uniref:Uncharacterized protein n=1 Tax=Anopheles culicifacies TaxID=139723 RepID=A0A182M0B7_9DIPT
MEGNSGKWRVHSTYLRGIVIVRLMLANFHTVRAVIVFSTTIIVNGTTNTNGVIHGGGELGRSEEKYRQTDENASDCQGEDNDLCTSHRTHGLAFQRIQYGDKALHGERDHKPNGEEAAQRAGEGEKPAAHLLDVDFQIDQIEPGHELADQVERVAQPERRQIVGGGKLP